MCVPWTTSWRVCGSVASCELPRCFSRTRGRGPSRALALGMMGNGVVKVTTYEMGGKEEEDGRGRGVRRASAYRLTHFRYGVKVWSQSVPDEVARMHDAVARAHHQDPGECWILGQDGSRCRAGDWQQFSPHVSLACKQALASTRFKLARVKWGILQSSRAAAAPSASCTGDFQGASISLFLKSGPVSDVLRDCSSITFGLFPGPD